jgi:hypothetical protein
MSEQPPVPQETINIDGTPHEIESLSDLAKFYVSQLQDVNGKVQQLKFQVTQLEVANNGFMDLLRKEIASTEEGEGQ